MIKTARFGKVLDYEAKDYVKVLALLGLLALVLVFAEGFYYEHTSVAYQGVGLIGDLLGLPEAILLGFTSLINDLFKWIGSLIP